MFRDYPYRLLKFIATFVTDKETWFGIFFCKTKITKRADTS